MAGKKRTFIDWRCRDCNKTHSTKDINKRNENTAKEFSKFCNKCHEHKTFYRKDTSKGSLGNKK
jgi:ribosomal protein L33